jgi:hypothetical protein
MSCGIVVLLAVLAVQWLTCWIVVLPIRVRVPASPFFLEHVYNGYGDHNISLLLSFCIRSWFLNVL